VTAIILAIVLLGLAALFAALLSSIIVALWLDDEARQVTRHHHG